MSVLTAKNLNMQLPNLESKDLAHWMLDKILDHFTEDPLNRRCKDAGGFFYSPKSLKRHIQIILAAP